MIYREHGHLKLTDQDSNKSDSQSQVDRWDRYLSKWEEGLDKYAEVVVTGDVNINLSTDNVKTSLHKTLYDEMNK